MQNKVRITWEFPTELKVFKEENGEQPPPEVNGEANGTPPPGEMQMKSLQETFHKNGAALADLTKMLGKIRV